MGRTSSSLQWNGDTDMTAINLDELAANWIRAAGNVLGAMRDDS